MCVVFLQSTLRMFFFSFLTFQVVARANRDERDHPANLTVWKNRKAKFCYEPRTKQTLTCIKSQPTVRYGFHNDSFHFRGLDVFTVVHNDTDIVRSTLNVGVAVLLQKEERRSPIHNPFFTKQIKQVRFVSVRAERPPPSIT